MDLLLDFFSVVALALSGHCWRRQLRESPGASVEQLAQLAEELPRLQAASVEQLEALQRVSQRVAVRLARLQAVSEAELSREPEEELPAHRLVGRRPPGLQPQRSVAPSTRSAGHSSDSDSEE